MSEIISNYKVPANVRKKTTIAGAKMYDEFNLYSYKLVGLNSGCKKLHGFLKILILFRVQMQVLILSLHK